MVIKIIIALLLCSSSALASPSQIKNVIGMAGKSYDYCVRADGSAANKAAATSCAAASTSMSITTFNSETFTDGKRIAFSSRGGNLTSQIIIPSSGSGTGETQKIFYKGEPGYTPTSTFNGSEGQIKVSSKNYVEVNDFALSTASTSNLLIEGTSTGVITRNLAISGSSNQCVQHLNSVSAAHYNLTTSNCTDEGVSGHDTAAFSIYNSSISGYSGINWISTGAIVIDNSTVSSENSLGYALQPAAASYNFTATRTKFIETAGSVKRLIDFNASGTVLFYNCAFKNLGSTDFYLLIRATVTTGRVLNCVFYSGSITGAVLDNLLTTGLYRNNIFHTTTSGAGKAYNSSSGVDNTSYYNSGSTYVGTTYTTTDPLFVDPSTNNFHIQSGSPSIDQGSDQSTYFTVDIDGTTRSGTWDIGLDEI